MKGALRRLMHGRDGDGGGAGGERIELPISMIDVVFLLLIFFMCSMQFRPVEQKLEAELPKDEGPERVEDIVVPPAEVRVKICWANGRSEVIHSPSAAYPDPWPGAKVPLSTAGAHVEVRVNDLRVPDLNALARILRDIGAQSPDMAVVLDARQAVPFRWVIGAMDAGKRARMMNGKFQAPPVEGAGGADWWWM